MMKQSRTYLTLRFAILLLSLGALIGTTSSCGIMGTKDPYERKLAMEEKDPGCLDHLGPLMNQFLDGSVPLDRWDRAFACLDDALNTFSQFVKGSHPDGFDHEDLRALFNNFIFKEQTASPELIASFFDLKTSLFGGSNQVLTRNQINDVRNLLKLVQSESKKLIPHLKNRKDNPTDSNLENFITAFTSFGNQIADFFQSTPHIVFSEDSAVQLLREIIAISEAKKLTPEDAESWTKTVVALKYILVRGEESGFSGTDWKEIIRIAVPLGAHVWAFSSYPGKRPLLEIRLASQVEALLNPSFEKWNGSIPTIPFEKIVNVLPSSILEMLGNRTEDLRVAIKKLLNPRIHCPNEDPVASNGRCSKELGSGAGEGPYPVTKKAALLTLLGSRSVNGFDRNTIHTLVKFYSDAQRGDYLLEQILNGVTKNLTPSEFLALANSYSGSQGLRLTPEDQATILRLKGIAMKYKGLFQNGTDEITFGDQSKHSKNNLSKFNWYELMAQVLLNAYGSGEDTFGNIGTVDDLFVLVQDFNPLLIALSMVHPDKREVYKKRFREINLFMPSGNGDLFVNSIETAEYFAFLISSSRLSKEIQNTLFKKTDKKTGELTGLCNEVGFDGKLQLPTYEINCFRSQYLSHYPLFFRNMPGMLTDLNNMGASEKEHFNKSIEASSKMYGYDNNPISGFDVDSYGGIPHFIEGVMQKYDTRGGGSNGYLDWTEVNEDVFPIFKNELSLITHSNIELLNRAILIWLMQEGTSPIRCKNPSFGEIWKLIKWVVSLGPMQDFKARRIRIYEIFEALSLPPCEKDLSFGALGQIPNELDPWEEALFSGFTSEAQFESWLKLQPEYQQLLEIFE